MLAVIFRSRYCVNASHVAKCKHEAVLLVARRKFRGVQLASAGYYLSRRTIYAFEPLRPLYQATHLLILQRTAPCTNYAACKHLHNLATRLKSQLTCCLLITQFHTLHITTQAKSVYLGSGGGKNATAIALR